MHPRPLMVARWPLSGLRRQRWQRHYLESRSDSMNELTSLPGQLAASQPNPQMLGRYRILRRIGQGGMGEVWLCEDPQLRRQVAIKTLHPQSQEDQGAIKRFEREARAAAALTHPHILPLHDFGKQALPDGSLITYLVMPYVEGNTLAGLLSLYQSHNSLMPPQQTFAVLAQAAEAIDYAHQKQIIHRDIKPANMLLRDQQILLLADFGIARMLGGTTRLTKTGSGIGTPEYMAPEQIQGRAGAPSDIYSLAVLAYQLFTGALPFSGETAIATMMMHLTEPPPPPRQVNPALSPVFEQVLLQGLARQPEQRPALASEFVARLQQTFYNPAIPLAPMQTIREIPALAFQEEPPPPPTQTETSRLPLNMSRRQLVFGGAVAATTIAGIGLGTWGYLQDIAGAAQMT